MFSPVGSFFSQIKSAVGGTDCETEPGSNV